MACLNLRGGKLRHLAAQLRFCALRVLACCGCGGFYARDDALRQICVRWR